MSTEEHAKRVAARVRAAIAYAALTYEGAATGSGLTPATIRRICSPSNPRGASTAELVEIAKACSVDVDWLTLGRWDDEAPPPPRPFPELGVGTRERRLAVVEHYLEQLLTVARASGELPQPPEMAQLTTASTTH